MRGVRGLNPGGKGRETLLKAGDRESRKNEIPMAVETRRNLGKCCDTTNT